MPSLPPAVFPTYFYPCSVQSQYSKITSIEQSFQDGCDTIVSGCTSYGSTPSSNSPADIVASIGTIYTNRYNSGRTQGQNDVKSNPAAYGLYVAPKTQSGSVGVDPVAAGVTVSKTVTFPTAFGSVPSVNASANGIYNNNSYSLSVSVTSVSRSGFTVSIRNTLGSARLSSVVLSWNAVA